MHQVALLGTGLLGSGFAEGFLTRGGVKLTVWNRTRAKALPLAEKGATVADDPEEAVHGATMVHLILLDDATVDSTIERMRDGLSHDAIIVDHTTNLPARVAARAERLEHEGLRYLHAPVFMSPAAARAAQGIMMVAGPPGRFEQVRSALTPMTGDLWYVGERPDLAASYKLFGNAMILSMAGAMADIFHLADALDVPRAEAWSLFSRFKPENIYPVRAKKILAEDYSASFELEVARKDARLMLESAANQPMPVIAAIAARMDALIAEGLGAQDMAILAK
ncbi:MAG TPA: NAD(P)-binding domain-containing protein [Gemmatimonadaceae bacterium]|jgi:3-hydroxyisobutyrate dehydrogenase|nr:NAD(P)-dependent oxidoreductase [Gemmatimonadota bacterium]HNV74270.1 NAD(P)-binding domain-containing protein [Gemmatimonadaceae bacterium]